MFLLFKLLIFKYLKERGYPLFSMIPLSFKLDLGNPNFQSEFRRFIKFFFNENYEEDYSHDAFKKQILKDIEYFKKRQTFFTGKNLWLIKPAGKNRGQGIFVFNSLEKLNEFLHFCDKKESVSNKISTLNANNNISAKESLQKNCPRYIIKYKENLIQKFIIKLLMKKSYSRRFVIQKYMEAPLLINKRKFDIRVWVLFDQNKNLYFFRCYLLKKFV